jgi:hypothetical protein
LPYIKAFVADLLILFVIQTLGNRAFGGYGRFSTKKAIEETLMIYEKL